jgi:hypothetical protein
MDECFFTRVALSLLAALLTVPTLADSQQVLALNPEAVDEAIQLAADDKAVNLFLERYIVQTRAGWGDGPLIGRFSTPFARVVQVALAARKRGEVFTAASVAPELLAPELHVVAMTQKALSMNDDGVATVQSVVLGSREKPNDLVPPLKTIALTAEYQKTYGTTLTGPGVVAIFPLAALTAHPEIHVAFDRIARGSPSAMCFECVVPINLSRIR